MPTTIQTGATASSSTLIAGADPDHEIDLVLVNAPLRDYSERPRVNDFTLPVLGMGYIATYAKAQGFNVGVLDAEAAGLGIKQTAEIVNQARPRWAGFNLLAPTYEISADIAASLDPAIHVMLGSHQAKAMPARILSDPRMHRCTAMVLGEAETRVAALLDDWRRRGHLPSVMWLDPATKTPKMKPPVLTIGGKQAKDDPYLAPDINALPFVDRAYLTQDPRQVGDRLQANVVGARGCPYNCSFCGASEKMNRDITIRVREPGNILAEMYELRDNLGVTAFRFVDDLFLGVKNVIEDMMEAFAAEKVGEWAHWDATGRINILDRLSDADLDALHANGLREVALGIESGSQRMLKYIDKRITPEMAERVTRRLAERGINVKGYFIVGFHTETEEEINETEALVYRLWDMTDPLPGEFTASMFEFRPYPGTPDWIRLMETGQYTEDQLLDYKPVDLTDGGADELMLKRDEFNFSINLQLSEAPIDHVRAALKRVSRTQHQRNRDRDKAAV